MSRAVRYHVVSKIAHGGMAEIFLAVQLGAEGFQKQVVLKRILPALAADPSFVRMLVDEAHIASTLNHSNLVQVLDLGKAGDQFFLVLEFVDGWSLEQARRRAQKARVKLPLPLALYVVGALCRALAYVHTRKRRGRPLGIVHRDVTPQNVLLSREGEVKLADFGIAKAIGKSEKSATGVIKGKFAYMSPEQSMGGDLDARSDLFSVGTLLYLLVTGRKPFEGTTDLDVLMQVRKARYEKPSTLVRDFNPEVERFIARALRADRARRWQTAEQMADRIEAILMKLGQTAGPSTLKRWLDHLSTKDGARPPAEMAELAQTSDVIELGSRDLELEEVAPPSEEDGGSEGQSNEPSTRPEGPRHDLPPPLLVPSPRENFMRPSSTGAQAYADYGVDSELEDESTPPPPATAPTVTSTPDPHPQAAPLPTPTPLPVRSAPYTTPSPPARGTQAIPEDPAANRETPPAEPSAVRAAPEFVAPGRSSFRQALPSMERGMVRGVVAGLFAVIFALALLADPYLPAWLIGPVKAWRQRTPPPDSPEWMGDPRPFKSSPPVPR